MPRQLNEIKGYGDVQKVCRKHKLEQRTCSTNHVIVTLPDGSKETLTKKREYGPKARTSITKRFLALGLLPLIFIIMFLFLT